ncbi:MAG: PDZ domain-containing protein [Phycisphaerales bacterium]|jgi:hypothetical protein|nr:PDZ domain-containing protein [Phycisphaerales bacterium]MBT7170578.1 PDZ domain-containing protein [Phycisphaerales bacterium]
MTGPKRFALFLALLAVLVCGRSARADEPLARIEIAPGGSPIIVPVTLGGKTYSFLLTTTLPRTAIDPSLREHLGKPKEYYDVTKDGVTTRVPIFYAPDAKIAKGLTLKTGGVVVLRDFQKIREITGLDIRGMIGMSFLRQYTIRIDFDRGLLDFYKALPPNAAPKEFGSMLKVTFHKELPFLPGELFGRTLPFLMHLSYPGSGMLEKNLFTGYLKSGKIKKTKLTMLELAGGTHRSIMGRIPSFSLKTVGTFTNLLFDSGQGNFLGLGFFRRFNLTLDFPNGRLFFAPSKQFRVEDQADMSGLHLRSTRKKSEAETVYIEAVAKGSPAEAAGLKSGDVLIKINSQNILDYTLAAIRNFLKSKPSQRVELVFRRGKKLYKTSFLLKKQI